jgi:hypothetical protein
MPRAASIRSEILGLLRAVPFRPFVVTLDSGQQAVVGHPENIAFDLDSPEAEEFHILSRGLRLISTFSAISGIELVDRGGKAG